MSMKSKELTNEEQLTLDTLRRDRDDAVTQVVVCQDMLNQARIDLRNAEDNAALKRHALQVYEQRLRREGKLDAVSTSGQGYAGIPNTAETGSCAPA